MCLTLPDATCVGRGLDCAPRVSESEGERCGRGRGWNGLAVHLAVPPPLTLTVCRLLSLYLFYYPSVICPSIAFFVRVGVPLCWVFAHS